MPDDDFDASEMLVSPISAMIESIGTSVAAASMEINRAQLVAIRSYPRELSEVGLMPSIFHMQAVEVELKLALHLNSSPPPRDERGAIKRGGMRSGARRSTPNTPTVGSSRPRAPRRSGCALRRGRLPRQ